MKNKKLIIIVIIAIILIAIISLFIFNKKESNLIEVNKTELKEKIDNKDSFILVISRKGCSHCAEYLPILKSIIEEYNVKVYLVDTDKYTKEDKEYLSSIANFSGTPTTIFIENGEETSALNRIVGSSNRKDIIKTFKQNGYIK